MRYLKRKQLMELKQQIFKDFNINPNSCREEFIKPIILKDDIIRYRLLTQRGDTKLLIDVLPKPAVPTTCSITVTLSNCIPYNYQVEI